MDDELFEYMAVVIRGLQQSLEDADHVLSRFRLEREMLADEIEELKMRVIELEKKNG